MSQTKAQLLGPLVADDISVTGGLNLDNGTLKVDPSTNRVGINNANPTKTLDVGGDGRLSDLYLTADYPTIRPSLDLAFALTKELDSRITFTRNSTATFVDKNGVIQTASINTPRFDHNPITGESLGLLIEESRTNLLLGSSTTLGTYFLSGGQVSKGTNVTAPDGTLSAYNNVYTGGNGDANIYYSPGEVTTTNSTNYTLSIWAKIPSSNTYIHGIRIRSYNSNFSASFNLSTGTIVGSNEGTTTNRIESFPDGWYRCSITFTSGTDGNQGVQFYMLDTSNSPALNNPAKAGESLYYWGAQLEQGNFPTSYIPTTTSTSTRAIDAVSFNVPGGLKPQNVTSWYNPREGTWIIDTYKTQGLNDSYAALFYTRPTNSGVGARNEIYKQSGNSRFTFQYGTNNYVTSANIQTTTGISAGHNKIFAYYKLNDFGLGYNATIEGTDTTGDVQVNTDSDMYIVLGSTLDSEVWNGHFKRFTFYPRRLNNSQIQNITL